jgi:hypothetical protein
MSKGSNEFKDILNALVNKISAERPKHALPYGSWVKSFRDHSLWGVVTEARDSTEENKFGDKMCTYMVHWLNNGNLKGKSSLMHKSSIESDFSLIVPLDEQGNPFIFENI